MRPRLGAGASGTAKARGPAGCEKVGDAGGVIGELVLELDQGGGEVGHGMGHKANRMFMICSYPKRPPLSQHIVAPEAEG